MLCEQLWDAEGVDNDFNKNVNAKKRTTHDQLQLPCASLLLPLFILYSPLSLWPVHLCGDHMMHRCSTSGLVKSLVAVCSPDVHSHALCPPSCPQPLSMKNHSKKGMPMLPHARSS